jgi:hypothetical protein
LTKTADVIGEKNTIKEIVEEFEKQNAYLHVETPDEKLVLWLARLPVTERIAVSSWLSQVDTIRERELRSIVIADMSYKLGIAMGTGKIDFTNELLAEILKIFDEDRDR